MKNQEYLTVNQVASLLQVHWQSVLNYIKRGELEAIKLDKGYRIQSQALEDFINKRKTKRGKK